MRLRRRFRPVPAQSTPRRILVVQLDHLGDAVLTSPLLTGGLAFPTARIDVLASPSNQEVFEADPNVDRVRVATRNWFARRRGHFAMLSAVVSLGRCLRDGQYDLGIDVRGDILTVFMMALARIPRRVGWSMGGGGFLLTDVAPWIPGRHEVRSRLALLDQLGVQPDGPARVLVHISDDDRLEIARRFRPSQPDPATTPRTAGALVSGVAAEPSSWDDGPAEKPVPNRERTTSFDEPDWLHAGRFGAETPLLAVHLGAGTLAKRWPLAHWNTLIDRFLDDGWRVIVIGGPDDAQVSADLPPRSNLDDWTGTLTVAQTAALLERADLFIGADSGPSHLAACAGVPSVVLFSGTNRASQWRPWSRRSLILKHHVPCRPCHEKICPLADHPCMSGLDPDRVHRAARRWWSRLHRQESPHAPV
ncbi:MAG: glycosyltransferase family 9 protein [Isosphaeraceae bacterium]